MKIIELTAENVKRLVAVDITPDEHMQVIGGRNAQGKTSVLDAIWLALGGGAASKSTQRPIRDGETDAKVRLDLGDLVVTRTWRGDKTTLTVQSADGAKYSSPQGVLDALIGRLSFDPLAFTRLSSRDQVAALLGIVDLDVDLDALAGDRQRLYDERVDIGRQGKSLGESRPVDPEMSDEERSAQSLILELRGVEESNRETQKAVSAVAVIRGRIEDLEQRLSEAHASLKEAEPIASRAFIETDDLESALVTIEATNAAIRANREAKAHEARRQTLRSSYDALTSKIGALDESKRTALAAATFPVTGLGFDDDGVTLEGIPFSQASSAEQIRVSLAMAMQLNPKLRVVRILDGSLLDTDTLELIENMAREHDYQVWIERVGDADPKAVVIEDGQVRS